MTNEQKPIEVPYEEPKPLQSNPDINLEQILGVIPHVTSAPTWIPRLFKDNFAHYKSGATKRFYVYDSVNHSWDYVALT